MCPPFSLLVYVLFLRTQHLSFSMPYLMDELARVEKQAMSIIFSGLLSGNGLSLPYQKAIELVKTVPIVELITGLSTNTLTPLL